jgi:hypothetical protein
MTPIQAADPASKTAYTFTDPQALHDAIRVYLFIPLRPDGSPFQTQFIEALNTYVLDGVPLHVWIDGVWGRGEHETLEPYWNSGAVPRPSANMLNIGFAPMMRFYVESINPEGRTVYDTGASYPACSRSNPDGCQPIQFGSLDDVLWYASQHNETPIPVQSSEEAFALIEAERAKAGAPAGGGILGMDTGTLVAVGAGLAAIVWISRR